MNGTSGIRNETGAASPRRIARRGIRWQITMEPQPPMMPSEAMFAAAEP